jgi:NADH-quinone oxidoreductase subunit M
VQQDMKKLIAYSSIAHMGFVTLGCFVGYEIVAATGGLAGATLGLSGAMVQMVSHGLVSGALFLCVGVLYDRLHTREIGAYGGVINTMPVFGAFMVLFAMANAGLPGTSGFVGEFLVILASFEASFWYAFVAAMTLILGAAYTLWLVKRVVFGAVANEGVASLKDLNGREFLVLGLLGVAVLALGLYPKPLTDVMEPTLRHLVQLMSVSKL